MSRLVDETTDRVVGTGLPVPVPARSEAAVSFDQRIAYLLSDRHQSLPAAAEVLAVVKQELPVLLRRAFGGADPEALLEVHKGLFPIYEASFSNPLSAACQHEHSPWLMEVRATIEEAWMRWEVEHIEQRLPEDGRGRDPERLSAWFVEQAREMTSLDRRVVDYLAHEATLEDFKFFVLADAHLNYRFYDALVLSALHFSETVKAELSHHLWDESGEGDVMRAHTVQFTRALRALGLSRPEVAVWDDWRAFAGYNLYLCFGLNRRHYFKALGSLAMPELFDPDRDRAVVAGLERLGFSDKGSFSYYYSHIDGDEEHGPAWLENVIVPIVRVQPDAARELAIGGAIRMETMRRFNQSLAKSFGLGSD